MDELKKVKKDIKDIKASIEAIKSAIECLARGPYIETGQLAKLIEKIKP